MLPSPITGHQKQIDQLMVDLEKDTLAHAYLFCGRKHVGKFTTARWFASEILTVGKDDAEKKEDLKRIKKLLHPDFLVLDQLWIEGACTDWDIITKTSNVPQQRRAKEKVKTDVIGIDDIRAIQDRLHETAQTGRTCCLIRSIERLHITAANALLKILEEPPAHVTFCFTTESPSKLPETLVSRMRVLQFSPLNRAELTPLLEKFDEKDQSLLLDIAEGCPGIILRAAEDPDVLRRYRQLHIDAEHFIAGKSRSDRLKQLTSVIEKGEAQQFFQHVFIHLQSTLRSENRKEVETARALLSELLSLLHALQSNANKALLATNAALQCSTD